MEFRTDFARCNSAQDDALGPNRFRRVDYYVAFGFVRLNILGER